MIGSEVSSAIALPSPVVEPPPIAIAQSAPTCSGKVAGRASGFDRHVHHGFGVDARRPRAKTCRQRFGLGTLLWRGQHDRARGAEQADLAIELVETARTENHA